MRFFKIQVIFWTLLVGPSSFSQTLFNDSHFHLTNYIQEGTEIETFLNDIMGDKVHRVALFGIPLQQTWSYANSADYAPTYYLQSDAPLYYYSFTDAFIAMQYLSLNEEEQKRFDPMITGFNPADMYAADHIERVLKTFPGVFSGIGEFTIHKEFVSSKVAGEVASLINPALDRVLDFCAETGLLVILHSDIDIPFQKPDQDPVFMIQMKDLISRNPNTTIIWAHTGLGRVVHPNVSRISQVNRVPSAFHLEMIRRAIESEDFPNLYFDISWDEVAKYVVRSEESLKETAMLLNEFPDRFLFGTDEVAPSVQEGYLKVYNMYAPLWEMLTPETKHLVTQGNYERLFDQANAKVREWEKSQGY
ncbi:amidohydrolase family protein [Algoriphagus sediminis]|uniref:Amidohydrolase family protein n=1 Tax=Algoriphagus sediminis TaxID=3057113 RepID=A0ABT7YEE3_9BACT|nr:amidohydrolase family protein [Algoriphagus sediminis]MDN3204569.1 amidohydrolase family protein [Algoriphagus sediminis]